MKSLSVILFGALALAAPSAVQKRNTPNSSGTNGGFYYQFWSDGNGAVTYTNGANGEYSVTWNGNGDFTAGKGWNPGSARNINFGGSYTPSSSGSLAVYGWTTNPLVEYYIMENYPGTGSGGLTHKGSVTSDGSSYEIYENTRTNQPSIQGTATFQQYISIRQTKRSNGTVTTGNHFDAWKGLGMDLGTFNYQIVSTEAWSGSGSSKITVS
ncbi:MAG: hypothetical protein M1820_006908 [Bogoriella megaspora]|nr:MAG: hypothetical protein M1820_006908 [Bogoriella megaspora]